MKFRIVMAALLAAACFAQTAPAPAPAPAPAEEPKPPAEVDQALRARINEFYGLLLKKEFRKAEAIVAEDTKDYYYNIGKPDVTKYELLEIHYSSDFTHATVISMCTQKTMQPGFPMSEWSLKVPSLWKLESGNWFWYVNQTEVVTPVGIVTKVDPLRKSASNSAEAPATGGGIPKDIPTTPDFAMGKVGADKKIVTLDGDKPEKVTIVNGAPGPIRLMAPQQLGLDVQLEKASLGPQEKATLTLRATKESKSGYVFVQIIPTGETLAIQVVVK
jgi:hypothetical protein